MFGRLSWLPLEWDGGETTRAIPHLLISQQTDWVSGQIIRVSNAIITSVVYGSSMLNGKQFLGITRVFQAKR